MKNPFTIALLGNPNSGKTTLFNLLTKSGEPVGNRAGVTFSAKKEPICRFTDHKNIVLMDLPGIYSLSVCSNEEKAALNALKNEKIHVLLNIIDATNLERGLFLTLSLLRLGIPIVVALSMMDEAEREGIHIDIPKLSNLLGIHIFPISAIQKTGIRELIEGCLQVKDIPSPIFFADRTQAAEIIREILAKALKRTSKNARFERFDAFICRPIVGIPLFFAMMSLVFFLTFSSLGGWLSEGLEKMFLMLCDLGKLALTHAGVSEWLCLFLTDGIWMGVASVLAFIPQTAILFLLLAMLEDSGYLARAVFVMDNCMRRIGVSGKAIIPMIIGFGCTVPAVMATTTLEEHEKKRTIASLPFIPCNARLPIILFIASSFFEHHQAWICILLYFLCILATILSALLFQKQKEEVPPILMELPKYRFPRPVSLLREVKNKLKDFFVRAATVVFLSCVIVDLLALLTPDLTPIAKGEMSILALLGEKIAPLFSFLGFGDGRIAMALAAGFFAKESIVSTIQILIPEGLSAVISPAGAFSLTLFSLLYTPCAATLAAIRRELGTKNALYILLRTFLFAAAFSYIFYTVARLLSK